MKFIEAHGCDRFDLTALTTYDLRVAAEQGVRRRPRSAGRPRRDRWRLDRIAPQATRGRRTPPASATTSSPASATAEPSRSRWAATSSRPAAPLPDRLDRTRVRPRRGHERLGRHPRFRTGPGRQDQRGRGRATADRGVRHGPRDGRGVRRRRPRRGAKTISASAAPWAATSPDSNCPHADESLVFAAHRAGIPCMRPRRAGDGHRPHASAGVRGGARRGVDASTSASCATWWRAAAKESGSTSARPW